MAVQYDSENNSWYTWLDIFKNKIPEASNEAKDTFIKLKDLLEQGVSVVNWDKWIKSNNLADKSLIKFLQNTKYETKDLANYQQYLKDTSGRLSTLTSFTKKAGAVLKGFAASLSSMGVNMAIGIAIDAVATAIDNAVNSVEYAEKRANEFTYAAKSQREEFNQNTSKVAELNEQYQTLSKGVSNVGENVNLTTEEYKTYKDVVSQISEVMPSLNTYYNDQGEKIGFVTGKLKDLNKEYDQHKMRESLKLVNGEGEDGTSLDDVIDGFNKQKDIGFLTSEMNNIVSFFTGNSYDDKYSNDELLNALKELRNLSKEEVESKLGNSRDITSHIIKIATAGLSEPVDNTTDEMRALQDILDYDAADFMDMDNTAFETFKEKLEAVIDSYQTKVNSATNNLSEGLQRVASSQKEYYDLGDKKKYVDALLSNISYDIVDDIGITDEDGKATEESIRLYVNRIIKAVQENKGGINDAFANLFSINLDDDSINITDAYEKTSKYIDDIAKALGYDEEGKKYLKVVFGFESIQNQYDDYTKKLNSAFGNNTVHNLPKSDKVESKIFQTDTRDIELSDWAKKNNVTLDEIEQIKQAGYDAKSSIEDLNNALEELRNQSPKTQNIKSFSKSWSKLNESDQNTLKKEALEGVLDKDCISEFQDLADNFSLKQIRNEILSLIPLDDKLSQFIDDSSKLSSAYFELNRNKKVSAKTLLDMPKGIQRLKGYTDFKNTVSDPKAPKAAKKEAFEDIITEYLSANKTIIDASEDTRNSVINALKDTGIVNAENIVDGVINSKNTIKGVMSELNHANDTDAKNFANACSAKNLNNTALYNKIGKNTTSMLNQLKDNYADDVSNFGTALRNKLEAQEQYETAVLQLEGAVNGGTSNSAMPDFFGKSGGAISSSADPKAYNNYIEKQDEFKKADKKYRKWLAKLQKNLKKIKLGKIDFSPTDPSDYDKPKETKTEIDWLSRRLTRMQTIIDLTASKLQNLFSIKAKNKNLNDQIKETTALMKQYGIAAKRYQSKADSIADGKKKGKKKTDPLPKSILNQVESGKITKKSYPKLIKKYGQNYADRINQYIDYYDKAKDAKKNKQDAKAKVRDLKQQRHQTYIDLYDSRIARAEAKESIQTNAEGKNKTIKTQIENTKESYAHQIKIANLTKNKAEADRLKYEKQQKIKELKEKGLQYYADEYNAKADLAETRSGNAVGYQKQNSYVDTQLSYLQKSYEKQIAIAKLSKDKTEQDRLQAEYEAKKTELKQKQIENLKTDFENKIGFIRNDGQDVSNRISEAEARGDIVQSSYYSALNRYEQSALNSMETELQELKKEQGSFAMYSPEWYSLQSDIQSVENSISETTISIIENNKKIGELRQAMYDDIASRNNNVGSEAQFIAELLGDNLTNNKTGTLTKEGLGVLGTYGIELEANTSTALSYANQRKEIEQAIASYNGGNVHALDNYGSLTAAQNKLSEVTRSQQDAVNAEYATMKKIYDMMVKQYETQLAYMKTIIDAKKQVLSMEKDLYDYQKNISNQTKNIAALEKQLAALKGDDSEEGRAKRSRLMVSLDEANQNLQDTEYDRYISDQQNMLDNMYTQYEDLLSELEKDFEAVVKDGINIINETASGISTTLNDIANKYGYNPSSDMSNILGVMKSSNDTIVKTLPETITNGLSGLGNILQDNVNAIVAAYSGKPPVSGNNSDAANGGGSGSGSSNPGGTSDPYATTRYTKEHAEAIALKNFLKSHSGSSSDITKPLKKADPGKTYKSKLNQILSQYGYVVKSGTGTHGLKYINMFAQILGLQFGDGSFDTNGVVYKKLKKKYPSIGFRTGGIVRADGVSKDGDYVPVRVNPDETILTQKFTKMLPETVDIMKDFIHVTGYARLVEPRKAGNTFGDIVINAELPNVTDTYDFANDLQNNKRTQKSIEVSVHDLMTKGIITNNIQRI